MYVSGTSEVRMDRKSIGFYLNFHSVKGAVCGNSKGSGYIWFGEDGLAVVYRGDTCGGLGGVLLSCIANW